MELNDPYDFALLNSLIENRGAGSGLHCSLPFTQQQQPGEVPSEYLQMKGERMGKLA
jgi:hypothetical protein